jgi:hypothetical protein
MNYTRSHNKHETVETALQEAVTIAAKEMGYENGATLDLLNHIKDEHDELFKNFNVVISSLLPNLDVSGRSPTYSVDYRLHNNKVKVLVYSQSGELLLRLKEELITDYNQQEGDIHVEIPNINTTGTLRVVEGGRVYIVLVGRSDSSGMVFFEDNYVDEIVEKLIPLV